ncbi:DUF72 domain-containing protein [Pseudomonas sp. NPDC012596]|uniref:DUF72 domain-containing protein n=1 Tax=Pseudomonas sp. NPDC012596 TaxID=3364419 RepID=UPI0036A4EC90
MIHLGCAGWSVPRLHAGHFPQQGTQLQRYATRLNAVEINSSFYRAHQPKTYTRWAASAPEHFRFSVKLPKAITHEKRLVGCTGLLEQFLQECGHLGDRLGCLLVQLPPSLAFDVDVADRFFTRLRKHYDGWLAVEPRHPTWATAQSLLVDLQVAQVAASPSRFGVDAQPGGWQGLVYWRLHGEPQIYRSAYARDYLQRLAARLQQREDAQQPAWCIFDNTASGAALGDALATDAWLHGRAAVYPA